MMKKGEDKKYMEMEHSGLVDSNVGPMADGILSHAIVHGGPRASHEMCEPFLLC